MQVYNYSSLLLVKNGKIFFCENFEIWALEIILPRKKTIFSLNTKLKDILKFVWSKFLKLGS